MAHRNPKAISMKIRKLRREGFSQRVAVGRAFGILRGQHKKRKRRKKR